jgi:hypothetical protein
MTIANKGLVTGDCEHVFSIFMPCLVIMSVKLTKSIFRQGYKKEEIKETGWEGVNCFPRGEF